MFQEKRSIVDFSLCPGKDCEASSTLAPDNQRALEMKSRNALHEMRDQQAKQRILAWMKDPMNNDPQSLRRMKLELQRTSAQKWPTPTGSTQEQQALKSAQPLVDLLY